jgi:hypothetical protein
MANEPERPIEKLLRDAATKRREEAGAPLELHPTTRRLLQGEVARTFAKVAGKPRSFPEVLGQLWPRFVWGVAIFAVLVVVGYVLLPPAGKGRPEALLAKSEPRSRAVPTKQALPPPPAAVTSTPAPARAAPQLGAERQLLKKDGLAAPVAALGLADRKQPAEAPVAGSSRPLAMPPSEPAAPVAPSPVPMSVAAASAVVADESKKPVADKADQASLAYKSLPSVASANRPKSSYAATDSLLKSADATDREIGSASASQRFAQAAPGAKAKSSLANKDTPAQPVLASFQVEQTGTRLRIVDGDGSVYSGSVQIADAAQRQRSGKVEASATSRAPAASGVLEEKTAAGLDADQLALQSYAFRVTGTNRSLHKKVVFTGTLLAATNPPTLQSFTNRLSLAGSFGGGQASPTQSNLPPLLNSRISGKVVVGNAKAVEINALPTSP